MSRKYESPFTPEQEKFIRDNCTSKYIKDIAQDLGFTHTHVYTFIQQNNLKQKKVMKPRATERVVQYRTKQGKVREGYFNVHAKQNWAI